MTACQMKVECNTLSISVAGWERGCCIHVFQVASPGRGQVPPVLLNITFEILKSVGKKGGGVAVILNVHVTSPER